MYIYIYIGSCGVVARAEISLSQLRCPFAPIKLEIHTGSLCVPATMYLINVTGAGGVRPAREGGGRARWGAARARHRTDCTRKPLTIQAARVTSACNPQHPALFRLLLVRFVIPPRPQTATQL